MVLSSACEDAYLFINIFQCHVSWNVMCNVNGGYSVNQYLFVRPGDCHLMCIACFLGETDEG